MRKDYDGLKARYYNDTQEVAMTGRSNVFIEIMSVVDDFERAKVRPVGRCVRGGRGTPAHPIRQRQRLTRPVLLFYSLQMAYKPQSEEEAAILADYAGVQDAIIQGMIAQGMEEIKTVGEVFDFKLHDCMFTEQSVEHPEDIITRASRRCCWGGLLSQTAQPIIQPAALPLESASRAYDAFSFPFLEQPQEFSKGFMIGGKVIRPAKVASSTGPGP